MESSNRYSYGEKIVVNAGWFGLFLPACMKERRLQPTVFGRAPVLRAGVTALAVSPVCRWEGGGYERGGERDRERESGRGIRR